MYNKNLIKLFLFSSISALLIAGFINYLVDPLSETKYNVFSIDKVVQTVRRNKLMLSKKANTIDNLVLGSSRSMQLNPETISKYLGGSTFNFAVNSGLPEDFLGTLRHLIRENKIPKNIILGLDFYFLNDKLLPEADFLSEPELNFLNLETRSSTFFSLDKLILSMKNIYMVVRKKEIEYKLDNHGYLPYRVQDSLIKNNQYDFFKNIQEDSQNYMNGKYSYKQYDQLSPKRIDYLLELITLCEDYNIKLYVFLSPVHSFHYKEINKNNTLTNTLIEFKREIRKHFSYYDFMYINHINNNDENFYDSVHIRKNYTDLILANIFNDSSLTKEQRIGIYTKKRD